MLVVRFSAMSTERRHLLLLGSRLVILRSKKACGRIIQGHLTEYRLQAYDSEV